MRASGTSSSTRTWPPARPHGPHRLYGADGLSVAEATDDAGSGAALARTGPIGSPVAGQRHAGRRLRARSHGLAAQVWSRQEGYPGDECVPRIPQDPLARRPQVLARDAPGVDLGAQGALRPGPAAARAAGAHAGALRPSPRRSLRGGGSRGSAGGSVIAAPFDTELFGHWWFEGPDFLGEVYRALPGQSGRHPEHRVASTCRSIRRPARSSCTTGSWGANGDFSMWLNDRTAWTWPRLWPLEAPSGTWPRPRSPTPAHARCWPRRRARCCWPVVRLAVHHLDRRGDGLRRAALHRALRRRGMSALGPRARGATPAGRPGSGRGAVAAGPCLPERARRGASGPDGFKGACRYTRASSESRYRRCPRSQPNPDMTTPRSVVIHGHFYQPPREDPWLDEVEPEPSRGAVPRLERAHRAGVLSRGRRGPDPGAGRADRADRQHSTNGSASTSGRRCWNGWSTLPRRPTRRSWPGTAPARPGSATATPWPCRTITPSCRSPPAARS